MGEARWDVETIERDWLGARISTLAVDPEAIVEAFRRSERLLGRTWIESAHSSDGTIVRGTAPTLQVVAMGQGLAAVEELVGAEKIIDKIRLGDTSAQAELLAIYLIRREPEVQVELEPPVGARLADFRVRKGKDAWVYVEVALPDSSEATERAKTVLERVASLISPLKKQFALEVFLRREPTEGELARLLAILPGFCGQDGKREVELDEGLGLLFLNNTPPGEVVLDDHGEEHRPRIASARGIIGPNEPHRHIVVRMAYSDGRAEEFLRSEARQLPNDAPGLIMMGISRAPGAIRSWEPLLRRRFQPNIHTRVSGVCLFGGGFVPTAQGESWLPETRLLLNPHAKFAIPEWVQKTLVTAGAEFERAMQGPVGNPGTQSVS